MHPMRDEGMEIVVFFSEPDLASQNIWTNIQRYFDIEKTSILFDEKPVYKYPDSKGNIYWLCRTKDFVYSNGAYYSQLTEKLFPKAGLAVMAGFHTGHPPLPILTVHSIGNPTAQSTKYVSAYTLAYTSARAVKNAILYLKKYMEEFGLKGFEVMQEVTHGSPVEFKIPIIDFEIGSTEKEYKNELAGKVLAHALFHLSDPTNIIPAIGIGGLHYATKFRDVNLYSKIAVGHIFATFVLHDFKEEIFKQAIEKTIEKVEAVVIDKKEKGEYKQFAKELAKKYALKAYSHGEAQEIR
jgi:D-aminoacyl-tRNA deacylase